MTGGGLAAARSRWRAVSAYDVRGRLLALPAWARLLLLVALIAFVYGLPYMTIPVLDTPGSNFATVLFFPVGMYVLCAVGLDLAVGRAGIVNFGFAGFFALGAYTMAWLATKHGVDFYATLPIAAVVGALAALILG